MEENLNLLSREDNPKSFGFFSKLIGIFISPSQVLENIYHDPKLLVPLIYSSIVMTITYFIRLPLAKITLQKLTDISMQKYGADLFQSTQDTGSTFLITGAFMPISTLLMWFFGGLFLWILVRIFGGKSDLKKNLSLYAHTLMISITGALVAAPIGLLLKTDISVFSLAAFMPNGDITSFLYNYMMLFEVFSIWGMIIAGFGISIFNQFSKIKSMIIVFLHFILGNAFAALMTTLPYLVVDLLHK